MAYRVAAAGPKKERLDLRPAPIYIAVIVGLACPFFFVPGVLVVIVAAISVLTDGAGLGLGELAMGLAFTAGGATLGYFAYRMATSIVRFETDEDFLEIEWRRGRRSIRQERIARGDVQDVSIDESLSSESRATYRLVIGTSNGDIPLTSGYYGGQVSLRHNVLRLEAFLQVPLRWGVAPWLKSRKPAP